MKKKLLRILLPSLHLESNSNNIYDVDAMLVSVAYHRLPLTALLAFITVFLFSPLYYFYFFTSDWMLMWIAIVLLKYGADAVVFSKFASQSPTPPTTLRATGASTRNWRAVLVAMSVLSGLCWSFGPVVLLTDHFDSGEVAILCVSLLCVSGVTVAMLQGQRLAMLAYLLTALTPTAFVLLSIGGTLPNILALLLFTAVVAFAAVGFDFNYALRRLFETQVELARSAREASQAKDQAERSTALKSQFVANVSHEIRTPMHAILGMLKLLQNADLNDRQADYANKVEQTAKSLLGLLNDILDFSKIEAEQLDLSPHPFRLDRMLHDLSVVLLSSAQRKSVEVLYDIDPAIPKVLLGDAMRLRQVLLNIAGNAVKFTASGEVVLRIKRLSHAGDDCTLHFSIKDTGIGIAPENMERIFNEFSQTQHGAQNFGGTGLGLSISKRLVAMMGGELKVASTPGMGSTFFFDLTLQALESSPEVLLNRASTGNDLHALVVDGSATARELAVNMCKSWGWTVESAATGEGALALMRLRVDQRRRAFDVVVLDWSLPGMDGWQTIEAIHATSEFRPLPDFIVVSGFGHERLIERSAADMDRMGGFLPKPFTGSMLFDAIVQARSVVKQKAAPVVAPLARTPRLQGVRVLVVEDNLMNQQVVKELLELEGAGVEVVGNGQQAVDLLAGRMAAGDIHFDAVLMDLQMPNMDGYAATRIIRNELGLHNLPVIAITANMMSTDKEASFSAGMNAHIGKPFNIDLLVRVIQKEHAVTRS